MNIDLAPGQAVVLYDGDCPLCRASVPWLRRLDWLRRLHYQNARQTDQLPPCAEPLQPARLLEEMHVVPAHRQRAYAGFQAFRWMAWRFPLTMPLAPLAYIPGVPWIGNRIYLWVARNRYNLVPCHDGGCQVPLRRPK